MAEHHPGAPWRRRVPILAGLALAGCATAGLPGAPTDPGAVEQMAERENALAGPAQLVFQWSLNEPGLRVQGRGVARLEPPGRARLDLFARSGETVATAAVEASQVRLPPGTPDLIPPPALLWAALGIFSPGQDSALLGAEVEAEGEVHHLRYRLPDDVELRYVLRRGRLTAAELLRSGRTVERVTLENGSEAEFPAEASYRNLTAYRELNVTLESVEHVEGFPSRIWHPDR